MHRRKLYPGTILLSLLLATAVSFSCVMCLVDGFSMQCAPLPLLIISCISALVATAVMLPGKTWPTSLAATVLYLGVLLWQQSVMYQSLHGFAYHISEVYSRYFAQISVTGQPADCLPVLSALTMPLAWVTARVICREGSALFLTVACLPFFILCLMIIDIAPTFWLVLLTVVLLLLFLTGYIRERSSKEGSRLAWWLLLPTIILVTGITVLWPPVDYASTGWSLRLQTAAEQHIPVETLREEVFSDAPRWSRQLRQVNLEELGPKKLTGQPVLESKSPENVYYLRGVSLGTYTDNCWQAVDQNVYQAQGFDGVASIVGGGQQLWLQIRTENVAQLLYTPYYAMQLPEDAQYVDDAYVKNAADLNEYAIAYTPVAAGGKIPAGYSRFVQQTYTQVPADLQDALAEILGEWNLTDWPSPQEVADQVQLHGSYDLNTPRLPQGEEFVLYFLRESQRGYCVHFATATVMLLRAAGIPARYVTGYLVSGAAGQWVTVTQDDAHAWVEYWSDGMGWIPLDPTPAAESNVPEETPVPVPEESTQEPPRETDAPVSLPQTPNQGIQETPSGKSLTGLSWLLVLPGAAGLVWLRRWLILRRRRQHCLRGSANSRALALWGWLEQLERANNTQPEEDLLCLAEKARFSQHQLTAQELACLQKAVQMRIDAMQQYGTLRKLWYRYGLVLY